MADPIFRLACVPAALDGAPEGWATALLAEGELALLAEGGLDKIDAVVGRHRGKGRERHAARER